MSIQTQWTRFEEKEGRKKKTLGPIWKLSPTYTTTLHHSYHPIPQNQQKQHKNLESEHFYELSKFFMEEKENRTWEEKEKGLLTLILVYNSRKAQLQSLKLSNGGFSWRGRKECQCFGSYLSRVFEGFMTLPISFLCTLQLTKLTHLILFTQNPHI